MNDNARADHVARESILRLLSDDEIASVSQVEATASLLDGEEYLDLERLEQGVQNDFRTTATPMGRVLPRRAVRPATWKRTLERVAMLRPASLGTVD